MTPDNNRLFSLPIPSAAVAFWNGLVRKNADSRRVPTGTKTLLVAIFPYFCAEGLNGNAALFATQQDYHRVIAEMMLPELTRLESEHFGHYFRLFVDDSPFHEVSAAIEAGLGKKGRNNLLQNEELGSFVYIALVATDAPSELFDIKRHAPSECVGCCACAVACPGGAIGDTPEQFDRTLCASYISQQKGSLAPEKAEILKKSKSIYGCDICQKVCPANADLPRGLGCFCDDIITDYTSLSLTKQLKGRTPQWRGEAVLRRNINLLQPQTR